MLNYEVVKNWAFDEVHQTITPRDAMLVGYMGHYGRKKTRSPEEETGVLGRLRTVPD